ncbi:glycosyltransferase family 4 protein [Pseudodesulfovibrio piezophilus]|uniref:Glycosyl transferase group 1 n=1 Tax=Pseudodesulfovibrio piezophilus (strain DSM 21447 / JCM 15486 / C1TLV30) TaxID=1322246 RepID=M1WQD9_PSEP2|nr:glycosyltransferase family 4 protein [Pseudodesulfovibrio piezophilus]CCH47652.1 Glycosyl transferase group 1 [Pseudodesulfovibrio piezophilus C1TLV30]
MKVLLLDLGKIIRGGQRQVFYLARYLKQTAGVEPIVVTPQGAPLEAILKEVGIRCFTLPSGCDWNLFNIYRFIHIVSSEKPDIVHTNDAKGASLAALAKMYLGNFKLIHSRRVSYPLKTGWSRKKYLYGDALVAVSKEIQQILIRCEIPREKTTTIHSGIDATLYSKEKHEHRLLTIGAVGALSTQKGFEVLIEALAELKKKKTLPDWQCLIAGDGPLLQQLKIRADELELTGSIIFLGYKDSKEVLPEIDILAVPSIDGEGSNAVIKEGWASGTPVITSDLQSNLELVTHEQDGLIFQNRDAKDLALAIVRLIEDKQLSDKLIENGSITINGFTDITMAERYMHLYQKLVS